ncbi:hypothetical protein V5096_03295 [Pseudoalteromonas carrageenovora]|uniref:hypothetical protein n=1 Tax=Pseudoalteromonas carrageenovora TaxID=227 RepID=UPI002FD38242
MKKILLRCFAFSIMGCAWVATAEQTSSEKQLCDDYNNDKAIIIIGNTPFEDSEWYADWSSILNSFVIANNEFLHVYRASQLRHTDLKNYSVLFSKKSKQNYLLEEVIEPQSYEYVLLEYTQANIPKHINAFKPEQINTNLVSKICNL